MLCLEKKLICHALILQYISGGTYYWEMLVLEKTCWERESLFLQKRKGKKESSLQTGVIPMYRKKKNIKRTSYC